MFDGIGIAHVDGLSRIDHGAKFQIGGETVAIRIATGGERGTVHIGRGGINGVVIAKTDAVMREFVESGRVFSADEIRTHAIPYDEDNVAICVGPCVAGRPAQQCCEGNEEEFSEPEFQRASFGSRT